jgi:hypothetical protein
VASVKFSLDVCFYGSWVLKCGPVIAGDISTTQWVVYTEIKAMKDAFQNIHECHEEAGLAQIFFPFPPAEWGNYV